MKKKGLIMIETIVKLLLVIMILFFVTKCTSEFFRTSSEAKQDFVNLVNDIKDVAGSPVGERNSDIYKMDDMSAIVYFEDQGDTNFEGYFARFIFERPSPCAVGKTCICLFRNIEITDKEIDGQVYYMVVDKNVNCEQLDVKLEVNSCSVGTPSEKGVNVFVSCPDNGFIIERNFGKKYNEGKIDNTYLVNGRQRQFHLERTEEGVSINVGTEYVPST